MNWLVENPTWMLVLAVVTEAVLAVAFVRTGRGIVLTLMAGVAVLALAGLAMERYVVTDREQVEAALDDVAAGLVANDLTAVLARIAPEASQLRAVAETNMPRVKFTEAKIRDLTVTINRFTSPPSAEARFRGIISANDTKGQFPYDHFMQRFTVKLRSEGDEWLLTDYEAKAIDDKLPWQNPTGAQ
ncbi:MAG: hypothetical protein K1X71_05505 [Pirellulales bacterium]|nr:hypothetical protein [Pirellulales bacterium]